jgi:hypothetical protein
MYDASCGCTQGILLAANSELGEWSAELASPYFASDSRKVLAESFFVT